MTPRPFEIIIPFRWDFSRPHELGTLVRRRGAGGVSAVLRRPS